MNYDLTRLMNNLISSIEVDQKYQFDESYLKQGNIIKMDEVLIKGKIFKDILDDLALSLTIEGTMYLECAITLSLVPYPFLVELDVTREEIYKENDKNLKNNVNSIDILPIIWENILMEVPMRVESEDAKLTTLEGDNWKLITEEDNVSKVNPELSKLKDLL